jgi:hypothetical protein
VLNPESGVAALGQYGMSLDGARMAINALVDQQAVTLAMNHVTLLAAVALLVSGWSVWFMPRGRSTYLPRAR